ncbi:MAG: glycosyltransferase family 39 protein, partial [Candidatus Berkelbacteria bacterium]|nr:glycosyltransferase family 39 protein [Candidatus Berkelbacteria bacterium]
CSKSGCELNFALNQQHIDKIFLAFDYNEAPDAFEIYGANGDQRTLLDSVDKSRGLDDLRKYNPNFRYNEYNLGVRPYYASYVSGTFDSISIKILPPKEERMISIYDVFFYQKKALSTPKFIFNLLAVHPRSALSYLFYSILFIVLFPSAGLFVVDKLFRKKFSRLENAFFAFAFALVFWGLIGFILTLVNSNAGFTLALIAMFLSFMYFYRSKFVSEIKLNSRVTQICILYAVLVILYVFMFDGGQKFNALLYKNDVYFDNQQSYDITPGSYSSDQIVPYGSAKILLYGIQKDSKEYYGLVRTNILSSRTQLFSYVAVPFLKVFGDRLLIFEILGIVCVLLLPLSTYMLASEMTKDRRATYLAVFFVFTSPYLIYILNITQLKIIVTVLITAYFYFLFKYKQDNKKIYIIAGSFLAAVSMLIHNFTLIYVIAGIIYLSPNILLWFNKKKIVDLLILLFPIAIFAVWLINSYFDTGALLIKDVIETKDTRSSMEYFRQKYGQNYNFIAPYIARLMNFKGFFIADPAPMIAYRSEGLFRSTIYSLTSFTLFPFLIWAVIKHFKKYGHIWLYLLVLVVLALNSDANFTSGFGMHIYLVATIPLLLVIIAQVISKFSIQNITTIGFLVLAESFFINFVVQKELISDKLSFQFQWPLQTFLIFSLFALLQFSPLYYFLQEKNDKKSY